MNLGKFKNETNIIAKNLNNLNNLNLSCCTSISYVRTSLNKHSYLIPIGNQNLFLPCRRFVSANGINNDQLISLNLWLVGSNFCAENNNKRRFLKKSKISLRTWFKNLKHTFSHQLLKHKLKICKQKN